MWICLLLLLLATVVSKMAKIGNTASYPLKSTPVGADTVIGTDSADNDSTKQFTVQGLANFVTGGDGVVNSVTGTSPIQATPSSGNVNVSLATVSSQGKYDYATVIVDEYGRVIAANSNTPVTSAAAGGTSLTGNVTFAAGPNTIVTGDASTNTITIESTGGAGPGGTVTQVNTGTGLSGGPLTTTGTIALANTAVTAGSYTVPTIAVNAQGQITSASSNTIDLQYVLNNGGVSNGQSVILTGTGVQVSAPGAVFTSSNTGSTVTTDLRVGNQLLDFNNAFGSSGQVLVADPNAGGVGVPGVVWANPSTFTATASISSAALNAGTSVQVVAAPGAGKYIQVISAAAKYNYGTTTYSFNQPLKLYTNVSSPQFELDENYLALPASQVRAMSLTTSGALTENGALSFAPAVVPSSTGDGDIELNVQYRIVEF